MTDYLSEQLKEMAPHRAFLRAVESRFMGRVPLERPVLDIGCGDGHFASVAYGGRSIDVGIDVFIRDLREAAQRPGLFRHVMFSDACRLPFPSGCYGTVLANCVIEHIPDVDQALQEIARVLRPGGVFATTLPSEHYPEYLLGATVCRRLGLPKAGAAYGQFFNRISHHYHVYPPQVWKEKLQAVGLAVEEHTYYFSAAAHRRFDLTHYLSVPNLISKRLLGRWVLMRAQVRPFERWLRRYYEEPLPAAGAYQFVLCRKR